MFLRIFIVVFISCSVCGAQSLQEEFYALDLPHRITRGGLSEGFDAIYVALNSDAEAYIVLADEETKTAFVDFLLSSLETFIDWSKSWENYGGQDFSEQIEYQWVGSFMRFKKNKIWYNAQGPHPVSSMFFVDRAGDIFLSFVFPKAYANASKKTNRQQVLIFKNEEELKRLITLIQHTDQWVQAEEMPNH